MIEAVTLVPLLVSLTSVSVIAVVFARAPTNAIAFTVAMPIAVIAARRHGIGTATVAGVVGMTWGFASMISSPIAGLIADVAGDAAAYGLSAAMLAAAGLWLLRELPEPAPEPEPA